MASENEASCESDPNFAVICGFLEKFGATCGLTNIDIVDLQEMLENTVEVSQELIELHVKLMRRARRSVSSNSRWERALIKTCHTFSSQDAWEIERFGYKKARISSKLRVLKELLEMQFDYNQKFKNEINKISAGELRAQPLGRDRMGRSYWYQCDGSCQIRVYKEDPDDETWTLVAKDRDGLVSLISQLTNGDTAKSSSEPVSNEDSNSVEVEKPTLDTGQDSKDEKKESDPAEKMEVEAKSLESNSRNIVEENASEDANLPDESLDKPGVEESVDESLDKPGVEESVDVTHETPKTGAEENEVPPVNESTNVPEATPSEEVEETATQKTSEEGEKKEEEEVVKQIPEDAGENALNLCSKDLSGISEERKDEKSGLDLSVKAAPCLRIKPITELMAQPQKKDFAGIKGKYIRGEHVDKTLMYPNPTHCGKAVQSASYDAICYKRSMQEDIYSAPTNLKHPRFDRPTLLGNKNYISYLNDQGGDIDDEEEVDDEELEDEEIEEPLMLVQGEGSGFPNQSTNQTDDDTCPIVGEEIEEAVMIVRGEGSGEDCDTGNKFETDSEGNDPKDHPGRAKERTPLKPELREKLEKSPPPDLNNSAENVLCDNNKNDDDNSSNSDEKNATENFNSPIKQNFFFGNSFSPNTSPLKTASLSFGASTVPVDTLKTTDENHVLGDVKCCSEKTEGEIVPGDPPQITKVPENVDNIENLDNNGGIEARDKLAALEEEDCVSGESAASSEHERECDVTVTDASDDVKREIGTSENMTDSVGGDIEGAAVLVTRTDEGNAPEIEASNLDTLSQPDETLRTIESSENGTSAVETLEDEETKDQPTPEVCESEIVMNDVTSLKSEDISESAKDPEIEEPTHKDEERQLIPDTHTEETTSETDCINKNESLTEMTTSTEENSAASSFIETANKDSPSASTVAKSPLVDVKDHINDQVDGDIVTSADTEKTNDAIVEEIEEKDKKVISLEEEEDEKCGKNSNVETKSSNEVSEEVKLVLEENQNDVCSKSNEESREKEEETGGTNHIANEALDETMADVNDKCSEETNNDTVTDAKKEEVNEDPSTSNEINQIEAKLPENLPTASSNNEQNTIVEKESNKVDDDPAKGIECMDEDSTGNSIPDMGHSDNDFNEEENDDKTDCITNSTNEITRESGEDVAKIPEDDAIKENDTSLKSTDDNVEIKENDKIISLEEEDEKCGKDSNAAEIEGNVSIIKDKENKVETIEISDDKSIGGGIIKEVSVVLSPITSKVVEKFVGVTKENDNKGDVIESKTIEIEKSIAGDTSPSNENSTNNEMATPIIIINDDDANDTGIEAIKAIKITSVQAKCEMPEQIKVEVDQNPDKTRNKIALPPKEEAPKPQPLRFLRGRRPNQMLSVKSYATRNKNLVLRKEIKPPPVLIEEKTNNTNVMNNTDDPLLKIIKSEDATEMPTRRSTRRRPADSIEKPPVVPRIVPVEVTKRGRGRQRKIIQPEVDSKRLRLSNNRISEAPDLETIDLTSESDGRKISVKNCDESILLKGGITIKPVYNNDKKKNNGPFLSCVNIQKLKENPPEHIESPLSVASSGGGDNSDVVIIEDDPLAVPEPLNSVSAVKPAMTLNSLQFDVDPPSPPSTIITRSLRKRGITEPEIVLPSGGKRRKTKGKRQVDLELRRSIEEQKKQEVSSSDEDKKEVAAKRKPQVFKKKPDTPPIAPVKKPRAQRKKTLLGLDVPEVLEELNTTISSVRQSRRIAQLKIKEEAERRKLEEINAVDSNKEQKRKGKKNIDKDYKAEKRKRPKPPTEEEEVTVDVPEVEEKKTKRKRRRKDRDPRKIFDESNPWRSSSDSSSSNDDVEEEEEEIVEYSEAESPLFKSDHEFSPESDIEDGEGAALPLKRARTARKEDEDIEDDTDEHACQKCGKSDHPEWILLCDGCDNGWHCSCLRPALFIIPEGDWFCPPCQHNSLVKQLETKLVEYDKKMAKREIEVRRKERLAYVGISLANVLPVKDGEEKRKKKEDNSEDDEGESASIQSESSSESSSSSDSDEPIYQLRQRRQAHSYRFNDYDDLINSAIQDEMEAVKGAGNQGRGKDISTIVNAEKEEMENKQEKELEELPPVVPQESKELPPAVVPPSHEHDSEEEKIVKPAKKLIGRKKQRKLNSLDVSSGDDPDSDEDFKGSSSEEEDEDDFEDLGSDSSEAYGRRRKGMPVRRSTRARTSRYDKDFINDDSDDEELPRKKKSRSIWDESESEESDRSWGRSSRRKSKRASGSKKKRSKKSKKHFDDSEEDRSKKKKRRIKYGGLNDDDDEEEEIGGRRTRGKKINYADVLASDSDDEIKRRAPPRIESDDDYVANEEEQEEQDDEDFEKEESGEEGKDKKDESQKKDDEETPTNPEESKEPDPAPIPPQNHPPEAEKPAEINTITEQEHFDIDNLNSSIDDLPDDLDNDEDDGLNPIEEINKNLEEMDEEEMEKLMEEEEYANKQLQLMAMQLEKEKKRREREAKKKEMALASATVPAEKSPKKRGKKNKQGDTSPSSNVVQIGALQVGPDMQSNPELSEPPGITIPIFSEIPPPVDASPKKRRGRGKGKKTLEKEAAAAAAAAGSVAPTSTPAPTTPSAVASDAETTHIPTTVDTVASISEDMSLANAAALHGAKLAVAAPPQPFSQTQPTPSVITRMLQAQPGQGGYSPMGVGHNYYADQPPQHADNPAQVVANAQIPVGNSLGPPGNHNQQLPPMSQSPQQYMHGTSQPPRGLSSTSYRQPPPNVNPYHRSSPAPPVRVRTPAPTIPNVYHSHHPLDPSPSGGGPINVPPSIINNPDSPVSIPPSSDSPLSNKSDPTPPPPPYNRPPMRFTNVNTTPPMSSSPIRQQPQQQQQQQSQNLLSPQQHLPQQQQSSPLRNNLPPYHPAGISPNYYGGYMPGNIGTEDALPPTGYHYSDQFSETNSPQDLGKGYDEENSGEFGGLVSYFSSQREDDLDT